MLMGKTIAVVVPCYNEATQIVMVLETMPDFVDKIVVVNDASTDTTAQVVLEYIQAHPQKSLCTPLPPAVIPNRYNEAEVVLEKMREKDSTRLPRQELCSADEENDRILLINHLENGGVGAAISSGYIWCRNHCIDCTAVMAGDGQMAPDELESICLPVVERGVDYVKGNRLSHKSAKYVVPRHRYLGNSILSFMTKITCGYWNVSDTQTGYTAISLHALELIDIAGIYRSYGCPNDILAKLNIHNCTLTEVPIKPVYRVGESSKMKIFKLIPRLTGLLLSLFFQRLFIKYFKNSFHPLFLFYLAGMVTGLLAIPFLVHIFIHVIVRNGSVSSGVYIAFLLLTICCFQSIGFAMFMDIQDNEKLCK